MDARPHPMPFSPREKGINSLPSPLAGEGPGVRTDADKIESIEGNHFSSAFIGVTLVLVIFEIRPGKSASAAMNARSVILLFVVVLAPCIACAQNYPTKPIRMIVHTAPSGGTDLVARMVSQKFPETLGQPGVVDNRGGANGIIGTDLVAKSPPDGYTVLVTLASYQATNPSLYAKLPYDTLADLAPVSLLAEYPYVLAVHPSLPVKTNRGPDS